MELNELKKLKAGDKLKYIQFGNSVYNGTVIENFPEKETIYIKLKIGFLSNLKTVLSYGDYNLFITLKQ